MMTRNEENERHQLEIMTIDQLVPDDHLVRKIDAAIDFTFIYGLVESLYSPFGRPSIDPVVLFKMVFIQYMFGIRSMRQTIKEIETNVAYRWFLGFGFSTEVPHFSTFGKNYARRYHDSDVFERIFYHILREITDRGLIQADHVFIDSTHVKASANKRKYDKKFVRKEAQAYQEQLQIELNLDREENGKPPFPPDSFAKEEEHEIKVSQTDPDSGYYVKDERTKQFAYSFHTVVDERGFVLGVDVTPGNVHDSQRVEVLVEYVKKHLKKPLAVAMDAAYKTAAIAKYLLDQNILPVLPYTRPRGKQGMLKKSDFVYDEYFDVYLCPQGEELLYSTTTKEGRKQYKSYAATCATCPLLTTCTTSASHQKIIERHVWEPYLEMVEELRHDEGVREIYRRRKETVERVFADAKEKHGMRWTTLRGQGKLSMQAMLTFAAMNLKKLAMWTWNWA